MILDVLALTAFVFMTAFGLFISVTMIMEIIKEWKGE